MDRISRSAVTNFLFVAYCAISCIEIWAEYVYNEPLIWASKPFMMPTLLLIYCLSALRINYLFVAALILGWIANLYFISRTLDSIETGAFFFLAYRILTIWVVLRLVRFPGFVPLLLGSLPFVFIYLYVINVSHQTIGEGLYMFVLQGLFISFLGGLAVGNYVLRSDFGSTLLLISTIMFAFTQFLFVIRLYYLNLNIFQPMAMLLFAAGQYILCKFVLISEKSEGKPSIGSGLVD